MAIELIALNIYLILMSSSLNDLSIPLGPLILSIAVFSRLYLSSWVIHYDLYKLIIIICVVSILYSVSISGYEGVVACLSLVSFVLLSNSILLYRDSGNLYRGRSRSCYLLFMSIWLLFLIIASLGQSFQIIDHGILDSIFPKRYFNPDRDIHLFGKIRPQLFYHEPSYLAASISINYLFWLFFLKASRLIILISSLFFLALFPLLGSPIYACTSLWLLVILLFVSIKTLKLKSNNSIPDLLLIIVTPIVFLVIVDLFGKLLIRDLSVFMRLFLPNFIIADLIASKQFFGIGLGMSEYYSFSTEMFGYGELFGTGNFAVYSMITEIGITGFIVIGFVLSLIKKYSKFIQFPNILFTSVLVNSYLNFFIPILILNALIMNELERQSAR